MNADRKTTLFSVFAFGLIAVCFVLLLQEVVLSGRRWEEIPRVFAGLLVPVPIALFAGFVFAGSSKNDLPAQRPVLMTLGLVITILVTIIFGIQSRQPGDATTLGIGPVIAQASVFSSSLINLLFARSALIATLLSGISIGLTIFVIFLT